MVGFGLLWAWFGLVGFLSFRRAWGRGAWACGGVSFVFSLWYSYSSRTGTGIEVSKARQNKVRQCQGFVFSGGWGGIFEEE